MAVLTAAVWSCGKTVVEPPDPEPTTIELSAEVVSLDALGATQSLTATVKDQDGNAMSGQSVTWTSATPAIATVSDAGVVTAVANGTATVTATSGSLSAAANVTVAQVPASLAKIAGDGQMGEVGEDLAEDIEVEVQDRLGNPVPGGSGGALASALVMFEVTAGGGSVSPASAAVNVSGRATATWTLGTSPGPQGLSATVAGGQVATPFAASFTSSGVALTPGAIAVQSGDAQSGTVATALANPIVVRVADAFDNDIEGAIVTFAVTGGGGSVNPPTATTDAGGLASATWTLGNAPGANELTFSVPAVTPGTATATGVVGPPATVTVQAGDGQSAEVNTAVTTAPSVVVADVGGNVLDAVSVTFAVASGGGSITGPSATTNASGIATVGSWTLGTTAGTNTLGATAGAATPATISATGTAGAATSAAVDVGDNQGAIVNTAVAIPPRVIVTDEFNNPVDGHTVDFAVTGGGGSITGASQQTGTDGLAAVGSWTLGPSEGANTLTATPAGLTPVVFAANGVAAAPASIAVNDGDNQIGLVGFGTNVAPSVLVLDGGGNPFVGAQVDFAVTMGGGSVTGASVTSDADGIARVGKWTLGAAPGTNTMTATAVGAGISGNPVTFTANGQVSAFNIEVRYLSTVTATQQAAFDSAVAKWMRLVIGDLSNVQVTVAAGACATGQPALNETVDDVVIFATLAPIDGPGQIIGQAGPCLIRTNGFLTIVGTMTFDTDDLAPIEAAGQLPSVILHEMGHVIGIGTLWPLLGFLQNPSLPSSPGVDTHFTGPMAIAAFDALGGTSYTGGAKVPVENTQGGQGTRDGHWRESTFDEELMTGFTDTGGMPLSSMTVASLWDLGYAVNLDAADPYVHTFTLRAGSSGNVRLLNDIRRGPVYVVNSAGEIVNVVQQ